MFGRRSSSPSDDPRSGLGAGWWAAAALMAVVIVALVGVLIVIGARDDTAVAGGPVTAPMATTALPAPPENGTSTQPSPEDRPEGCTTTGTDQTVPVDTPSNVTWNLVKGTAVPESTTDGPTLRSPAGVGYCYSRTPVGVVLAVSNLGRAAGNAQELQDDQLKYSTVPGPLADEIAATPAIDSDPAATAGVQYAGFRVISYTADSASVALAFTSAPKPGTYFVVTAAMEWSRGDWRVVVQPGPTILVTATATTSLADFVPWSGVS